MSDSQLTQGLLLPFRLYDEHDVINWYALNGTGLNGQFVALNTGGQDPSQSAGGYNGNPVGSPYTNVISYRYTNGRTVRVTQSGDTNFNTLGITLHTTAEFDENGNKLVNWPYEHTIERGFVVSGWSVPILTRGVVTLKSTAFNGTPIPGYVGCLSTGGNGKLDVVNPANLGFGVLNVTGAGVYGGYTVVGKWLSTTGANFGGYAQFKVQL